MLYHSVNLNLNDLYSIEVSSFGAKERRFFIIEMSPGSRRDEVV